MSSSGLIFWDLKSKEKKDSLPSKVVIAIGNFDGVHLGHKKLIETSIVKARELNAMGENAQSGVFCFLEPPADHLVSDPPKHLSSLSEKLEIFARLGAHYAIVGDFEKLHNLSPEKFICLLKEECSCCGIVCGFNFRFGQAGKGDPEMLKKEFGNMATVVEAVRGTDGEVISSSRIRSLVLGGEVDKAAVLLGHPFSIEGEVIHGKALGRKLGMPTINQNFGEKSIVPGSGIYVSAAYFDGKKFQAVTNIGSRPTVDDHGEVNCETHLIDFEGEIYGRTVSVELLSRLRDEKKFDSPEELKAAIRGDVEDARRYFLENK